MIVMPIYKCSLCGALLKGGKPMEADYNKLPEMCASVVKNQQFIGSPLFQVPMQIPHKCQDGYGSCGMAYFAGFKGVR